MTAEEIYESVTNGGASDFAQVAAVLERHLERLTRHLVGVLDEDGVRDLIRRNTSPGGRLHADIPYLRAEVVWASAGAPARNRAATAAASR